MYDYKLINKQPKKNNQQKKKKKCVFKNKRNANNI